ncbi:MAG: hypothetical protein U0800_09580 [Isosphaeraceae bacterium]
MKLAGRLTKVADSLGRVAAKGDPNELTRLRAILGMGLEATASAWPEIREAFGRIRRFAAVLANKPGLDSVGVRRRFDGLLSALARHADPAAPRPRRSPHFRKATRSYRPKLFAC